MDYNKIITGLSANREVYKNLLTGIKEEEYLWRYDPGKWCLLEIVCHLYDEEREDFRARVLHVLTQPELPLPAIDPVGWVQQRNYITKGYDETLNNFLEERNRSVEYLRSLVNPKWDNAYTHPKFGQMTATMFLTNWLAHDYLHFRQIIKLKFEYLKLLSNEALTYAGEW